MAKKIRTVCGDISPDELGITLTHEHLLVDVSCARLIPEDPYFCEIADKPVDLSIIYDLFRYPMISKDSLRLDDEQATIEELELFKNLGGQSLVEQTCEATGRDPLAVKRIAEITGLNIILGTGYFSPRLPEYVKTETIDQLADRLVREINEGIDGTDIRAGIVGEIGTSWPLAQYEEKVLRASSRAQLKTGAALSIHPQVWAQSALELLDIVESEGVDPTRVVICHLDHRVDVEFHKAIAARGAYVEYDRCGIERHSGNIEQGLPRVFSRDLDRVAAVKKLIDSGYGSQILLSQDVCMKIEQKRFGGPGYSHVLRYIVPMLKHAGIAEKDIQAILKENPARMLRF